MQVSVPLSKVRNNPFRIMEKYPINEEKIKTLMESIERTGFWDNVVARKAGDDYELAHGHHRLIAFKRKFGDDAKITLTVRDFNDSEMIKSMIYENMNEYDTSAVVEQESVRAIVQAYADGKIELERPKTGQGTGGGLRYAPLFRPVKKTEVFNGDKNFPYNAESIALWLGKPFYTKTPKSGIQVSQRIRNALAALEASEAELVHDEELEGLTSEVAEQIASGATRIMKSFKAAAKGESKERADHLLEEGRRTARRAVQTVVKKLKDKKEAKQDYGVRGLRRDMQRARSPLPDKKQAPMAEKFCKKMATKINEEMTSKDPRWDKLNAIIKYRDSIAEDSRESVAVSLERLADRCQRMAWSIRKSTPVAVTT